MSNRLRIGLIGCGAIAQVAHLPYLRAFDDRFELVALADTHRPTLDAVADHYHISKRYTDWNELLAQPDVDAVVICHNGSHYGSTLAALKAGKHIFVEKPVTWNVREIEEVAALAAQTQRTVQAAYHKLYDPSFAVVKQHLQAMKDVGFGRITVLHPENSLGLSPHRIRRGNGVIQEGHSDIGAVDSIIQDQLRAFAGGELAALVDEALGSRKADNRLRLGYGILCSSIIHQIYMLYGFLGAPQRVAHTDIWRDGLSIHAVIEYANDLHITLDWHYLARVKNYHEEYAFYGNDDRVVLQLPSPYFLNFPSPVTVQGGNGELAWEKRIIASYEEAFKNELLAFYDNVQSGKAPLSSIQDAVQHQRFIQQLIDAAH